MWWIILTVGLASAGLLVLAVCAARVWTAVAELAAQLAASGEALSAAGERLQRATTGLAGRAGDITRR
jgi:hypothetical protein